MPTSTTGLLVGLLLAVVAALGGLGAFLLAVVLGALGWAVGAQLDGRIDVRDVVQGARRG